MARTIQVDLGDRTYPIIIGPGLLAEVGAACGAQGCAGACLVVSDEQVDAHYGDAVVASLRRAGIEAGRVVIPAGEPSKDGGQVNRVYAAALAAGLGRSSFMIALGGGVVGDLAGFAAATFLRGIPYVQVPTTIVAMVDSAVGGKTGINLPQGKNLVGSFWQPAAVIADLDTLSTLPDREFRSGLAEVVKYGVIRDAPFFDWLERERDHLLGRDSGCLAEVVERSCVNKAAVVEADEREGGLRAILNFGHTLGHAVEKVAAYGTFLHGEAVAIGMVYAARLSEGVLGLPAADRGRLEVLLGGIGLRLAAPDLAWPDLRQAMSVDKKSEDRRPRFVLAERLGTAQFGCAVDDNLLEEVWHGLDQ